MARYSDEELEQMENEFAIDDDAEEGPIHRAKPKQNGKAPAPTPTPDELEGDDGIAYLMNPGYWCAFSLLLLEIMSIQEAVTFSYIMSHARRCSPNNPSTWFYLKQKTISRDLKISSQQQQRWISKLRQMGLIEQEMRGIPPKRFIKINYKKTISLIKQRMRE